MMEKLVNNTEIKGGTQLVFGVQGRLPWEILSRLPRVKDVKSAPEHKPLFLHLLKIKEGSAFFLPASSVSSESK